MAGGLGKRTGKPQRGKGHRPGANKKARILGVAKPPGRSGCDDQPKGPARVLAKEDNAKKKRAEMRADRFGRGFARKKDIAATTSTYLEGDTDTKNEDAVIRGSESASSEGGEGEGEEEGPHSSYNRLMQVLKKTAAESDEEEEDDEDEEEEDTDDEEEDVEDEGEDGEELEWEEVSSNDEEEENDADADDDDEDDGDEELEGAGRSNSTNRAKEREEDPEADRNELGLDADAPESDGDDIEDESTAAEGKKGGKVSANSSVVVAKGGFEKYFDATISAEEAEETETMRARGKWKKIDFSSAVVPGMLWRKG